MYAWLNVLKTFIIPFLELKSIPETDLPVSLLMIFKFCSFWLFCLKLAKSAMFAVVCGRVAAIRRAWQWFAMGQIPAKKSFIGIGQFSSLSDCQCLPIVK
jgi:hypothetical protein